MTFRLARISGFWGIVLTILLPDLIGAEPKVSPVAHGVVDVVTLKSGSILRGGITDSTNGKLLMAVALNWYRESQPAKAAIVLQENLEQRRQAWIMARDRLKARLNSKIESQPLQFFFKSELERIEGHLADQNPAEPDFVWVEIPRQQISKIAQAAAEQRRLALFAWSEGLAHVETREAASIKKELAKNGVKLESSPPELGDRLPPRLQDDREWSARLALVEYGLSKPLDFQGMGDTLTRTGESQQPNLVEILPKLFEQQLGSLLKDLTGDFPPSAKPNVGTDWMMPAIRVAESEKARGFRVTRVTIDSSAMRMGVETQFVVQLAPGLWKPIWRAEITEDGNQPHPAIETQIEQDPQIKSVLETVRSVGLIDPNAVRQAIRAGAATMTAQQKADEQFARFRERYINHVDAPPLPLNVGE